MQTSLMFVDLKPLGVTPDSQKIAIKMPKGHDGMGAEEYSGFSDMISALLAATPEQLQNSLGKMEWVKVHGDAAGYAPLIDLSAVGENGSGMVQMLSAGIGQRNEQSTGLLGSAIVDGRGTDVGKGGIDIAPNTPFPGATSNAPKVGISQIALPPAELKSDGPIPSQINIDLGGELGKNAAPDRLKADGATIPLLKSEGEIFKPADLHAKMTPLTTEELPLKRASNLNDPLATAMAPEEMLNKEAGNNEPLIYRISASQHQAATNAMGEQAGGQQLADQNGNGHDAQQFMKKEARQHLTTAPSGQNVGPAHGEGSAEPSADLQDSLTGSRVESRADFHPAASQMKMAPGKGVEMVSGHHDPISQTSDPQSNVIRQIVQRMALQTQGMQSTMTVKLKPEFLGNVHMQISTENQQVVVRMATESLAVKEMVEQGLQHLKTELQNHGLGIDKFDVFVSSGKEDSHPGQDLAGFRQALKERRKTALKSDSDADHRGENSVTSTQAEHGRSAGNPTEINYFA